MARKLATLKADPFLPQRIALREAVVAELRATIADPGNMDLEALSEFINDALEQMLWLESRRFSFEHRR